MGKPRKQTRTSVILLPPTDDPLLTRGGRLRLFFLMFMGAMLVLAGAMLGEKTGLRESVLLDFKGAKAQGTAERIPDGGGYRISYKHPSGAIIARIGIKWLGVQQIMGEKGAITLRYSPDKPEMVQPEGLSFLPGAAALALFLTGMTAVLKARSLAFRRHRARIKSRV